MRIGTCSSKSSIEGPVFTDTVLRLKARNWVFSYTPKELWEEVERLACTANQITTRVLLAKMPKVPLKRGPTTKRKR